MAGHMRRTFSNARVCLPPLLELGALANIRFLDRWVPCEHRPTLLTRIFRVNSASVQLQCQCASGKNEFRNPTRTRQASRPVQT
jgi:hypothetical protein